MSKKNNCKPYIVSPPCDNGCESSDPSGYDLQGLDLDLSRDCDDSCSDSFECDDSSSSDCSKSSTDCSSDYTKSSTDCSSSSSDCSSDSSSSDSDSSYCSDSSSDCSSLSDSSESCPKPPKKKKHRKCKDHSIKSVLRSLEDSAKPHRKIHKDRKPKVQAKGLEKESSENVLYAAQADKVPLPQVETQSTNVQKGKKFIVTFGPKDGHVWSDYNADTESVHINGRNGPVLHLYREVTYIFDVKQEAVNGEFAHGFVLTSNPVGVFNGVPPVPITGSFDAVTTGSVLFKVQQHTPRYFYYQDSRQSFAGGLIIVHDN